MTGGKMARQPKSKPEKKKGEVPVREAADMERDIARRETQRGSEPGRDIEKETPSRRAEYGEGVTQNE
jgi:hypothetical protein